MAKHCALTGRRPRVGNNVSHANNRSKRRFRPNLQRKRFWVPSLGRYVTLVVSAKALRTINKRGIDRVVANLVAGGHAIR